VRKAFNVREARFKFCAYLEIPFRLVLGGGYLLERNAGNGMFFRVAATYDAGAFRFSRAQV